MTGSRFTAHNVTGEGYRAQLDKSATLRLVAPLCAAAALPAHGVSRKRSRKISHLELAKAIGYRHRSSYTRNASKAIPIVNVKESFAGPNLYTWAFPEGRDRDIAADCYVAPSIDELALDPTLGKYWRRSALRILRKQVKTSGYDWIPGWIFHSKTPGGRHEKLVLLFLAAKKLFAMDSDGRCRGELEIPQGTIAAALGISEGTVRKALRFWSDQAWKNDQGVEEQGLGVLRIIEQPGSYDAAGNWNQPPNKIVYLAGRVLDQEQAVKETDRFLAAGAGLRGSPWWMQISSIHASTLKEWVGTERQLKTFWAECRRRMHDKGITAALISRVIPRPPD